MSYWPMRNAIVDLVANADMDALCELHDESVADLAVYETNGMTLLAAGIGENILRLRRAIGEIHRHYQQIGKMRKSGASRSALPGFSDLPVSCDAAACSALYTGVTPEQFEDALAKVVASGVVNQRRMEIALGKTVVTSAAQPEPVVVLTAAAQRHMMTRLRDTLAGMDHGLEGFGAVHPDVAADEAAEWAAFLSRHRLVVERLIRHLKKEKITSEQA